MDGLWEEVWAELREALRRQPPRDANSTCPCVRTLRQQVPNDILSTGPDGIEVRSGRTGKIDFIAAQRFNTWWDHLQEAGSASLVPGGENNPPTDRSRIIAAIWARSLPHLIEWSAAHPNEIRLRVRSAQPG